MSRRPRRNHTATFKAKVALAAIKGEKTLSELAEQFDVHANQITLWKSQLLEGAAGVFGGEAKAEPAAAAVDVKTLHAKIGALTLENDFLEGALTKAGDPDVGRRHIRTLMRRMTALGRPLDAKPAYQAAPAIPKTMEPSAEAIWVKTIQKKLAGR